jgi:hypothetical protein
VHGWYNEAVIATFERQHSFVDVRNWCFVVILFSASRTQHFRSAVSNEFVVGLMVPERTIRFDPKI